MLEKTHVRIAQEIAERLSMERDHTKLLESGSVRPDSFIPFPHHKEKDTLILRDIFDARSLLLKNDDEAFVKLGEACHFIADKWTLNPRIDTKHFKWEAEIDGSDFEDDIQFKKTIVEAVIPSKSKDFYEKLVLASKELVTERDFTQKRPLITELIENENRQLEEKQNDFLFTYNMGAMLGMVPGRGCPPSADLVPFPLISHIAWITREGTGADTYSIPSIDLNISLRLCLAICRFVFLKNEEIVFSQRIMQWRDLPTDWGKVLNIHVKNLSEGPSRAWVECPNCHKEIVQRNPKICPYCGIKICERVENLSEQNAQRAKEDKKHKFKLF